MTFEELKELTMFQLGFDTEDMADFEPHLSRYLNEGYQWLVMAMDESFLEDFQPLRHDREEPEWLLEVEQRAIADWATWRICSGGSLARQKKGMVFLEHFEQVKKRLMTHSGSQFWHY